MCGSQHLYLRNVTVYQLINKYITILKTKNNSKPKETRRSVFRL